MAPYNQESRHQTRQIREMSRDFYNNPNQSIASSTGSQHGTVSTDSTFEPDDFSLSNLRIPIVAGSKLQPQPQRRPQLRDSAKKYRRWAPREDSVQVSESVLQNAFADFSSGPVESDTESDTSSIETGRGANKQHSQCPPKRAPLVEFSNNLDSQVVTVDNLHVNHTPTGSPQTMTSRLQQNALRLQQSRERLRQQFADNAVWMKENMPADAFCIAQPERVSSEARQITEDKENIPAEEFCKSQPQKADAQAQQIAAGKKSKDNVPAEVFCVAPKPDPRVNHITGPKRISRKVDTQPKRITDEEEDTKNVQESSYVVANQTDPRGNHISGRKTISQKGDSQITHITEKRQISRLVESQLNHISSRDIMGIEVHHVITAADDQKGDDHMAQKVAAKKNNPTKSMNSNPYISGASRTSSGEHKSLSELHARVTSDSESSFINSPENHQIPNNTRFISAQVCATETGPRQHHNPNNTRFTSAQFHTTELSSNKQPSPNHNRFTDGQFHAPEASPSKRTEARAELLDAVAKKPQQNNATHSSTPNLTQKSFQLPTGMTNVSGLVTHSDHNTNVSSWSGKVKSRFSSTVYNLVGGIQKRDFMDDEVKEDEVDIYATAQMLQQEVNSYREQLESLQTENEKIHHQELKRHREQLQTLQQEIEDIRQQKIKAEIEAEEHRQDVKAVRHENYYLSEEKEELIQEIEKMKAERRIISSKTRESRRIDNEVEKMYKLIETADKEAKRLKVENETLRREMTKLQAQNAQVQKLREDVENFCEDVERSREEVEKSREEVERSREEVERSREEVDRSRQEIQKLRIEDHKQKQDKINFTISKQDGRQQEESKRRRLTKEDDLTSAFIIPDISFQMKDTGIKNSTRVPVERPIPVSDRMPVAEAPYMDEPTIRPSVSPGFALATVIKAVKDEIMNLKMQHTTLFCEYNKRDVSLGMKTRKRILAKLDRLQQLRQKKENELYSLYDVLEGQKIAGQLMNEEDEQDEELPWDVVEDDDAF